MKILYNPDGSVNKVELSNYVNQNNNNVDEICVAIIGKTPSEYSATAYFTLPTGTTNFLSVTTIKEFTIGDDPTVYQGKSFYLTNQQTVYAGVLSMSIEFTTVGASSQHLFTYNCKITINPTNVLPSDTDITLDEYQRIVEALAGKIETSVSRISAVDSGITAVKVGTYDAAVTSLTEHEANTTIHVTAEDKTTWNGHVANTQIHVTPEEKSYWNGKSIVTVDNQSPSTSVPVISYITINGNTYQILAASPGTTVAWGNISGNLADQLDLKTILDGKAEKTAIPNLQATTTIIADALTNINGRVLSAYEATYYSAEQSSTGYAYYHITKSTVNLTEEQAKDYMEYMSGSRFLPTYNLEKPQNSIFIMPDGSYWKPQYTSESGLDLYRVPNPYITSVKTINGNNIVGSGNVTVGATTLYKHDIAIVPQDDSTKTYHVVIVTNNNTPITFTTFTRTAVIEALHKYYIEWRNIPYDLLGISLLGTALKINYFDADGTIMTDQLSINLNSISDTVTQY